MADGHHPVPRAPNYQYRHWEIRKAHEQNLLPALPAEVYQLAQRGQRDVEELRETC
jgi:hypothetical protein